MPPLFFFFFSIQLPLTSADLGLDFREVCESESQVFSSSLALITVQSMKLWNYKTQLLFLVLIEFRRMFCLASSRLSKVATLGWNFPVSAYYGAAAGIIRSREEFLCVIHAVSASPLVKKKKSREESFAVTCSE